MQFSSIRIPIITIAAIVELIQVRTLMRHPRRKISLLIIVAAITTTVISLA